MSEAEQERDRRALVAVDLGAESCRVSLLRWRNGRAEGVIVHRFPNAPVQKDAHLKWDLDRIWSGVEEGLRKSAALAPEGVVSIAVDGWAVDYVHLADDGRPLAAPFCYRDTRNMAAAEAAHRKISPERLYAITGIQSLRFNTLYQLYADQLVGLHADASWLNLPEYILHKLGGRAVAEYTNATHTGLVDLKTRKWSTEIFSALNLEKSAAPELVDSGTDVGRLRGPLAQLAAYHETRLVAGACHDTASAIAGIPLVDSDWAYISSGTWSLVGTILSEPCTTENARRQGFTNLGAAGGGVCFHTNVNGMWLLKQCLQHWTVQGHALEIAQVIAASEQVGVPDKLLDVDDAELLQPDRMPERINQQLTRRGAKALADDPASAPAFASLIFHSLAARYAAVIADLRAITGRTPRQICIVGGGSRNAFLNRLTEEATGLPVCIGHMESSTIGNFAIQLAAANGQVPDTRAIREWACRLKDVAWVECESEGKRGA